jgi:hypothetical protein
MVVRCQKHVIYKVDIIQSLKSWDGTTLRCCYHVSDVSMARNDTEYSYRISLTWKEIPLDRGAEYICKAMKKEDGIESNVVEKITVQCKYSTVDAVVKKVHVCTVL